MDPGQFISIRMMLASQPICCFSGLVPLPEGCCEGHVPSKRDLDKLSPISAKHLLCQAPALAFVP